MAVLYKNTNGCGCIDLFSWKTSPLPFLHSKSSSHRQSYFGEKLYKIHNSNFSKLRNVCFLYCTSLRIDKNALSYFSGSQDQYHPMWVRLPLLCTYISLKTSSEAKFLIFKTAQGILAVLYIYIRLDSNKISYFPEPKDHCP